MGLLPHVCFLSAIFFSRYVCDFPEQQDTGATVFYLDVIFPAIHASGLNSTHFKIGDNLKLSSGTCVVGPRFCAMTANNRIIVLGIPGAVVASAIFFVAFFAKVMSSVGAAVAAALFHFLDKKRGIALARAIRSVNLELSLSKALFFPVIIQRENRAQ
jgi:hypothetical protein